MRLLRAVVFIFALGALLLPGCSSAEPVCRPADLVAPDLSAPSDGAHVADNTPWLTWEMKAVTYTSPDESVPCHPDKYRVSISTAPMFTDELVSEVTPMEVTGGWSTPALQEGKTYRWNVTAISNGLPGPTSVTRTFSIGSDCTQYELQKPVLLQPANGSIVNTTQPTFRWDSTMTCLPQGYFLFIADFDYVVGEWLGDQGNFNPAGLSGTLDEVGLDLEDCKSYDWAVYACTDPSTHNSCYLSAGPRSEMWEFLVVLPGSTCPTGVLPPPTAIVPPAPVGEEAWEVTMNANCRVCPFTACNESGFAPKGYLAPIEGRNEDATWFRIKDPGGVSCWVWGGALKVPADASSLGLLSYATPPPAEEPAAPAQVQCSRFKDIRTCIANPPCTWDRVKQACVRP